MDLSPNDIRSYEFPNQMRGYDKNEVDSVLDQAADALEKAKQESLRLSMEIESLKSQLSGLKQFEDTIKSAAIDARRNADMTIATAKQEAEMILSKAKGDAENILAVRTREVSDIENQITKLGLTKKSYLSKIHTMIQSHLEMINEVDTDREQAAGQSEAINITQSTDVTTEQRETLGKPPDEAANVEGAAVEDSAMAEDLKNVIRTSDEAPEPSDDQPIDPELAAALENYKKSTADQDAGVAEPVPGSSVPPQNAIIETTSRAEDIPEGFYAKEDSADDDRPADRVSTSESESESTADPDDPDADGAPPAAPDPSAPDRLAGDLDEVAAKFEEEMNKADSK